MDKVKLALVMIQKYHFWVLCSLAVIVALLCWTWATADLASRFERREGELDGHFDKVRRIPGNPDLRNERSVEATRKQHVMQKDQVLEGWEILYQQQKENNPLPAVLGDDFRREFESLRPGREMRARFRERYLNFIERHYPTLLRLVDVRRPADEPLDRYTDEIRGGRGRSGERRGRTPGASTGHSDEYGPRRPNPTRSGRPGEQQTTEPEPRRGLVEWPQPEIFDITAGWEKTPTTQQVLLAQENLWVYEALLKIISSVNEGVESFDKAWIKRINTLEIGRPAAEAWVSRQQTIFAEPATVAAREAADPMGMDEPGMGGPAAGMGRESGMGSGMGPGAGMGMDSMDGGYGRRRQDEHLLDGRYVDENGFPVSARQFETQPPYAEFKMMMVHMNLYMHQRRIPKLLVECANSTMPIEVARVRINPVQGTRAQRGDYGRTRTGMGAARQTRPAGPQIIREEGPGGARAVEADDHDYVDVEVFGIIYIYNPPDLEKLGTGAAADRPEDLEAIEPAEQPPVEAPPAAEPAPAEAPLPAAEPPVQAAPQPDAAQPAAPVSPAPQPPGTQPVAPAND